MTDSFPSANLKRYLNRIQHIKVADDLSPDTSFEQTFANLAFAVQNDTNPKLMQYVLGFQLLEKNEDETKAVGVMGLQLGDMIAFAPYFFKEGELFGDELLWLSGPDLFVPKSELWISYLINKRPTNIGQSVPMAESLRYALPPDFSTFRGLSIKYTFEIKPWAADHLHRFYGALKPPKWVFEVLANRRSILKEGFDLYSSIRYPDVASCLLATIDKYPRFALDLAKFYDVRHLTKVAFDAINSSNSVLNYVSAVKDNPINLDRLGPIKFYTEKDLDSIELTSDDKSKLLKQGWLIKDFRKSFSKVAELPTVLEEVQKEFITPNSACLGNVLLRDGDTEPAVYLPLDNSLNQALVILLKRRQYYIISSYCLPESTNGAFSRSPLTERLFNKPCFEGSSIQTDANKVWESIYSLGVHTFSSGSCVIAVKFDKGIEVYVGEGVKRDNKYVGRTYGNERFDYIVVDEDIYEPIIVGKDLIVPKDKISIFKEVKFTDSTPFASADTLFTRSFKSERGKGRIEFVSISVSSSGVSIAIGEKDLKEEAVLNKQAACLYLMRRLDVSESDALDMIQKAVSRPRDYVVLYKEAQALPEEEPTPTIPMPMAPPRTGDTVFGSSVPTVPSVEQVLKAPQVRQMSPPSKPAYLPLNPELVKRINEAAQTGQKEVFDLTTLEAMLATTRERDIFDKYAPKLLVGTDAIGRILFNLYWHRELFEDRLGTVDTAKLENDLKSLFTRLGDAAITLKEKNIRTLRGFVPEIPEAERQLMEV